MQKPGGVLQVDQSDHSLQKGYRCLFIIFFSLKPNHGFGHILEIINELIKIQHRFHDRNCPVTIRAYINFGDTHTNNATVTTRSKGFPFNEENVYKLQLPG